MITFLRNLLTNVLNTSNEIFSFLQNEINIGTFSATYLDVLFGGGLIVALGWCVTRWLVGFN